MVCPLTGQECTEMCAWRISEKGCSVRLLAENLKLLSDCVSEVEQHGQSYSAFNVQTGD